MPRHSGSLLRNLELSFALAAFLLTGFLALFMDHALRRSLEAEDALVMQAQAKAIQEQARHGELPKGDRAFPEKSEWRIVDGSGRVRAESPGLAAIGSIPWPTGGDKPVEATSGSGRPLSLLVRSLQGGESLQMAMDRHHEQVLLHEFRRTLVLALVVATALAAVAGRWAARRGLAPLDRIIDEARHIHPLRLDRRLEPEHFPQELGELVETLNGALERIQVSFDGLSRFAGELAHELRTPLQNLRSEVESLVLRPPDSAAQLEALGSILEECDGMASLIEKTLFLARTEDPAAALARETLALEPLLRELASFFEASAEEGRVKIEVSADPGLRVNADRPLLERALTNLISNALRHTPAGGWIRLGAAAEARGTLIRVQDSGPGIEPSLLQRLGQPWAKGSRGDGHGLGLAIVKGILRLHGGTVDFASPPGEGLQVELRFPE